MVKELLGNRFGKRFFEPYEVENVAYIEQADELILGHYFAKASETGMRSGILPPGPRAGFEFIERHRTRIRQVWRISGRSKVILDGAGETAYELRFSALLTFRIRGIAVIPPQFGRIVQAVRDAA